MRLALLILLLAAGVVAGCGGDDSDGGDGASGRGEAFDRRIEAARSVSRADFPAPEGRTLQQIADTVRAVQLGLATSVFEPGVNRLAFGVIDDSNKFVYGKSAIYYAPTPNDRARGPFPAPADPLVVDPPFRSQGAALESDSIAAIYAAEVRFPRPGEYAVLAVTQRGGGLVGGAATVQVGESDIPDVGERPPRISTETLASAGGDIGAIETRKPPDDMHEVDFADVVGEKPVVLLFSTPALCQTRVCGPVTDIAAQLQKEYGDRAEFIHQEVYEDNDVQKGLRAPLRAFNLETEPWLFTFDADGRVAARLEGSFGNEAFRDAVEKAIEG
jgi:hypothetical protein